MVGVNNKQDPVILLHYDFLRKIFGESAEKWAYGKAIFFIFCHIFDNLKNHQIGMPKIWQKMKISRFPGTTSLPKTKTQVSIITRSVTTKSGL